MGVGDSGERRLLASAELIVAASRAQERLSLTVVGTAPSESSMSEAVLDFSESDAAVLRSVLNETEGNSVQETIELDEPDKK